MDFYEDPEESNRMYEGPELDPVLIQLISTIRKDEAVNGAELEFLFQECCDTNYDMIKALKAFVMDDDSVALEPYREYLRKEGYLTAADGATLTRINRKVCEPKRHIICESETPKTENDALDSHIFCKAIGEMLEDRNTKAPMCIGLFGEWGSGKSWILKVLQERFTGKVSVNYKTEGSGFFYRLIALLSLIFTLVIWPVFIALCHCGAPINHKATRYRNETHNHNGSNYHMFRYGTINGNGTLNNEIFSKGEHACFLLNIVAISFSVVSILLLTWILFRFLVTECFQIQCGYCRICKRNGNPSMLPCSCSHQVLRDMLKMLCLLPKKHDIEVDENVNRARERCFIAVPFNSWEYAGCSELWAGVVEHICQVLEIYFGKWTVLLYRIIDPVVKDICQGSLMGGFSVCRCIPIALGLTGLIIFPIGLISLVVYHLFKCSLSSVWISLGLSIVTLVGLIRLLYYIHQLGFPYYMHIKNLYRKMAKPKFEEELGFMNMVKKEVLLINRLFKYMSFLHQKDYYPVLLIDDLDRCDKSKVKTMLEALHIMFNDQGLRFFSIVAVDQRILISAFSEEFGDSQHWIPACCYKPKSVAPGVSSCSNIPKIVAPGVSSLRYIKKIIHLPISLPVMKTGMVKRLIKLKCPFGEAQQTDEEAQKQEGGEDPRLVHGQDPQHRDYGHQRESSGEDQRHGGREDQQLTHAEDQNEPDIEDQLKYGEEDQLLGDGEDHVDGGVENQRQGVEEDQGQGGGENQRQGDGKFAQQDSEVDELLGDGEDQKGTGGENQRQGSGENQRQGGGNDAQQDFEVDELLGDEKDKIDAGGENQRQGGGENQRQGGSENQRKGGGIDDQQDSEVDELLGDEKDKIDAGGENQQQGGRENQRQGGGVDVQQDSEVDELLGDGEDQNDAGGENQRQGGGVDVQQDSEVGELLGDGKDLKDGGGENQRQGGENRQKRDGENQRQGDRENQRQGDRENQRQGGKEDEQHEYEDNSQEFDLFQEAVYKELFKHSDFIFANPRHITRILNICSVAFRLLFNQTKASGSHLYAKLVWFLVMAEQWPFRTSALLYLISKSEIKPYVKLYILKNEVSRLITLPELNTLLQNVDENPGAFYPFLKRHMLTVEEFQKCKNYMINLTSYMRKVIEEADVKKREEEEIST